MLYVGAVTARPLLRRVGFWCSRREDLDDPCNPGYPDPVQLVDPQWRAPIRDRLIAYLRDGQQVCLYGGSSHCRFDGCEYSRGGLGSTDLSDGAWIWPEGLCHYVQEHDVRIPDEMVDDIAARNFTCLPKPVKHFKEDRGFWLRWAADNTPARPPKSNACSLATARTTFDDLEPFGYRAAVDEYRGRWHLTIEHGGVVEVDRYLPPLAETTLRDYASKWLAPARWHAATPPALLALLDERSRRGFWSPPRSWWLGAVDVLIAAHDDDVGAARVLLAWLGVSEGHASDEAREALPKRLLEMLGPEALTDALRGEDDARICAVATRLLARRPVNRASEQDSGDAQDLVGTSLHVTVQG